MAKKTKKILESLWDKILLEPLDEYDEKTINGLYIPDLGKETPAWGKVVFVGPGVMNVYGHFIPNVLQIGDIVAIPRIGSFNLKWEGKDYYVTREQEILTRERIIEYDDETD